MSDWTRKLLPEMCSLKYGDNLPSSHLLSAGFPVYGANGIIGYYDRCNLDAPTVLVSCRGEYSGTINKTSGKAFVTNNSIPLRLATKEVDTDFFYYTLSQIPPSKIVSGSAQPQVTIHDLAKVEVHFPPFREQRKIARILTTVDKLIEKTESLIAKYQAIKQGMMHDLFTRGVDAHGHLRPPQAEVPDLYKQSELGWIPKQWDATSAKRICHEITKGATPAGMLDEAGFSNVPFIRVQNLSFDGTLSFENEQSYIPSSVHCSSLVRSKVYPGDVLMNLVGPPMGKVSLIPDTYPEWNINQAIAIFRTLDTNANVFLSFFLLSRGAFNWFLSRAKRTSGQQNLTLEMCRQLPVPIPRHRGEQDRITALLTKADSRLSSESTYLHKLKRIKTGLMQDLLTGKVRVKMDEAEEVAP